MMNLFSVLSKACLQAGITARFLDSLG